MKQTISILAPAVSALAGAGLWIFVSVLGRWEIGLLALGIGAAIGAATKWANLAHPHPPRRTMLFKGLLAAALTLLAIAGGKLGAAWLELDLEYRDYLSQAELAGSMTATPETAMFHLALDLVEEREAQGLTLSWPAGKDSNSAFEPSDLPPELWEESLKKWEAMPEPEKKKHIAVAQAALKAFSDSERRGWGFGDLWEVLRQNLDLSDIFFTLLAAAAAYRIATATPAIPSVSTPEGT